MTCTTNLPENPAVEGVVMSPIPTPRINLSTIDDVRREVARVYREMRGKIIESQDGTRLVYVLFQLGKLHEMADVEKRLNALEHALKQRKSK